MDVTKIKIGEAKYDIKDASARSWIYGKGDNDFEQSVINIIENQGALSKNTTGSSNKPQTRLYITGAEEQAEHTVTYSNNKCYIGEDNCLYSNGKKVITSSDILSDNDTKNTTGSNNKLNTQMFLVGSQQQSEYSNTYSNNKCYIGDDNCLYSNGKKAVSQQDILDAIYLELYGNINKPEGAFAITNLNIEEVIRQLGLGGISKYNQLGYQISHIEGSGNLVIPGTDDIYLVTVTANISSVSLQTNPTYGHSCHIIFKSNGSSQRTVTIANDNTNRICPKGSSGLTITVPPSGSGYAEVDFLNMGTSSTGDQVYVKGI